MGRMLLAALKAEIGRIKDGNLEAFVATMVMGGPDEFLMWPASSTGKYHPPDEIGPMGMLIHVNRCVALAPDIARMYELMGLGEDILVAACMLHDLYKQDGKTAHTKKDHMIVIYDKILSAADAGGVDESGRFVNYLANACLFHEGVWTPDAAYDLDDEPSIYATAMHTIDMMVTRRAAYNIMQSDWVARALESGWNAMYGGDQ